MLPKRLIFFLFLFFTGVCYAQKPNFNGISTAHPLATQAGQRILLQGGNAFDAAVAITAALAVVEPYSSGIGGGGFWLLHDAKNTRDIFLDGREKAPQQAHQKLYLDKNDNYIPGSSVDGPLAAGIPGTIAALEHISKHYGVLPLAQSLQPAIDLALNGFKVTKHYQRMLSFRKDAMLKYPQASKIFMHQQEVPELGFKIIQKDLANTLKAVATQGAKGFYQGKIANLMVQSVQQAGGIWTLEDLKNYQVVERKPIKISYKNLNILTAPPPSSGGIALATILNILSGYNLAQANEFERTHLIIEAMRRAYRDRAQYLGDSDFVDVPDKLLTSSDYAAGLRASIHPQRATQSSLLPGYQKHDGGNDTTHFVVMDNEGNSVSSTMSINYPFGSTFVAKGTGVLLNDEMDDFAAKPGVANVYGLVGAQANAIEPGKRPLSSMSPSYVEVLDEDQKITATALIGTPGGSRIITMVLLGLLDINAFNPQQWVNLPRFHHQYLPDIVQFEKSAFSPDLQKKLIDAGHHVKQVNDYGNMHALIWEHTSGMIKAAADGRGEGKSLVFK